MTALLYILAGVGFLVVVGLVIFATAWAFCRAVARAELRRKARVATLTTLSEQQ